MFTHVRIGSNDMARSQAFYDAVLGALGIEGTEMQGMRVYSHEGNMFVVATPREGEATHANGGTIGFKASSAEAVDGFHAAGLANGGSDEGAPGLRPHGMYAAYLRDPDGNKLVALAAGS
jgi:catechol 2,3-dioxygenase-like lactoylglutathione lyase family enzyme